MADMQKILKSLLGDKDADALKTALDDATKVLDKAGVQRKEGETDGGEGGDNKASDEAVLTALEAAGAAGPAQVVKNILDAFKGEALTALEEKMGGHEQVVAALLKAVAGPAPEATEPEAAMAEDEMMKSLKDYIASTTKDMGDLARGYNEMVKTMKDVAAENKGLRERLEKLEGLVNDRPRQASKEASTEVDGDDKARKALEASVGDTALVAGIRVKKLPGEK